MNFSDYEEIKIIKFSLKNHSYHFIISKESSNAESHIFLSTSLYWLLCINILIFYYEYWSTRGKGNVCMNKKQDQQFYCNNACDVVNATSPKNESPLTKLLTAFIQPTCYFLWGQKLMPIWLFIFPIRYDFIVTLPLSTKTYQSEEFI